MKRFIIAVLLLLIALLFLYAAYLDGVVAFAEEECEFCEYIKTHDLESDRSRFPTVISGRYDAYMEYDVTLYARCRYQAKGSWRSSAAVLRQRIPLNYCPECGRKLNIVYGEPP